MERSGKVDFFTTFHELCAKLLTSQERSTLRRSLQIYQTTRDVTTFVSDTQFIWSSPNKLQLLPFVRHVIAVNDRQQFDALLGVHEGLVVRGPKSDKSSSMSSSKSGNHPLGKRGGIHVIKVRSAASPRMGFSIRGGGEFGLGIYVSHVESASAAEAAGLKCGDQILETNGVDIEKASSQRALELLSGSPSHTLVVRRTRKIPEWKVTKERILWYDVTARKLMVAPSVEATAVRQPGSEATEVTERKVVLRLARQNDFVGINIRGGKEFGLGIYISRVDKGGLAERGGVEVGDQLLQVNKHHLDNATHATAVQLLRSSKQLVLTLRAVGKFPAYKELFSEYVWSDSGNAAKEGQGTHTADLHHEPRLVPRRKAGRLTQRTKTLESHVDRSPRDSGIGLGGIDLHNPDPDYDEEEHEEDFPVQTELFYPRDQDIIFRGSYNENWRRLDKTYGTEDTVSSATGTKDRLMSYSTHRSKSVDSDTDSSDIDMDYTTFLERKTRREEEKKAAKSAENGLSVITGEPALIRTRSLIGEPAPARATGLIVRVEPTLVKATDRVEYTQVKSMNSPELCRTQTTERAEDKQEKGREDKTEKPVPSDGMQVDSDNYEMYAVVHKPQQRHKQGLAQHRGDDKTAPAYTNDSTSDWNSPGAISASSRSSSDHSDENDSNLGNDHGRHHRTHIYHINSSPSSSRHDTMRNINTAVTAFSTKSSRNSTADEADDGGRAEKHYVVVTEVMDEVASRVPTPPVDYRRPSVGSDESSTSNSGSTVTLPSAHTTTRDTKGWAQSRSGEDSPTAVDLLTEEIRRLEARQSSIGSREIVQLGDSNFKSPDKQQKEKVKAEEDKKSGAWSTIKKKLTGSIRINKTKIRETVPSQNNGSVRKKGIFERTFGSQMMNQLTLDKYNLMMVEERARHLLPRDESDAVLRHIKTYHDNKDLERLVVVLMAILDRQEKLQLLKDIRGVVFPCHVGDFDSLVSHHEVAVFDKTSSKLHLPLNPVHRSDSGAKPRTKLMTTVLDADGHFHIQSVGQQNTEVLNNATTKHNGRAYITSNINNSRSYNNNDTKTWQRRNSDVTLPPPPEWRDDVEVVILEKESIPPPPMSPPPEEGFVVYVSKQKKNLGLIVCGGAGDHMDPSVRIEMVMPWGACADDERIQSGMHILSVDDQSVQGLTQSEGIALLKRCFTDTRSVNMKLRLKRP